MRRQSGPSATPKNVPDEHRGEFGYGDVWTWTASDADTKLVPSWFVGDRSGDSGRMLIDDLAFRVNRRMQLTTNGHKAYLDAIEGQLGADVDYAMLHSSTTLPTATIRSAATAPPSAPAPTCGSSPATPTRATSARPT